MTKYSFCNRKCQQELRLQVRFCQHMTWSNGFVEGVGFSNCIQLKLSILNVDLKGCFTGTHYVFRSCRLGRSDWSHDTICSCNTYISWANFLVLCLDILKRLDYIQTTMIFCFQLYGPLCWTDNLILCWLTLLHPLYMWYKFNMKSSTSEDYIKIPLYDGGTRIIIYCHH